MPYKSDKQRKFMHARHPEIAARWDKEAKMARTASNPAKPKPTVGKKAANSYVAGAKATEERGSKANLMRRGASVGAVPRVKAIRTTIKAGIRAKHPELKASKVRGRANKQTAALMKKKA